MGRFQSYIIPLQAQAGQPAAGNHYGLYAIAIALQAAVLFYFVRQAILKSKQRTAAATATPAAGTYEDLRSLALHVSAADLKLAIPPVQLLAYGTVMDWNLGETTLTLAAYITGAANLYMSTGDSISGGGKNPEVGALAAEFATNAQQYLSRAVKVTTTELPANGCIRFYLLTNHGIYAAQEQLAHFEDATSQWLPLFEKGSETIVEMRKHVQPHTGDPQNN